MKLIVPILAAFCLAAAAGGDGALARDGGGRHFSRHGHHVVPGAKRLHGHLHGHKHRHFHRHHHHRHSRFGLFVGAPLFLSPWSYPPSYYAPRVTAPAPPLTYIEKGSSDAHWYYCQDPPGYYPRVRDCAGLWQAVPVRPPAP